ncbi:YciI family protein [Acinetobacter stercoris]|uniref:YCII-related domain protein n=1 Tax=Acinetobacter stercoris TaxID=2126983 RepID=A0A2U3MTU8_9GAMM|nr:MULTISPECIES: YciI family protein [Acinetobacter]SPL68880.1 YCII-related domain protein [Acinetobacter stercoris]
MYVVSLNYHKTNEEIDALLKEHVEWLEDNFKAGYFIAAGRKDPRTGGMILVKQIARDLLDEILKQDPFQAVATYEITSVDFARTGTGFEYLKGI